MTVGESDIADVPVTFDRYDHIEGPFYHGTKCAFEVGDQLVSGHGSNFHEGRVSDNIYEQEVPRQHHAVVPHPPSAAGSRRGADLGRPPPKCPRTPPPGRVLSNRQTRLRDGSRVWAA